MKLNPRLSRPAVELVKRFEPFEPTARATAQGSWIIGYGHTRTARDGAIVSLEDAEALLLYDLSAAADVVSQAVRTSLTGPQFEALTAFVFSVGPDAFHRSGVPARLHAGAYLDAADEIGRWRTPEAADAVAREAEGRRRAAEKAHFLNQPPGESSAILTAANTVQARLRELVPDARPEPGRPELARPASPLDEADRLPATGPTPIRQTEPTPHHHTPFPTARLATAFGVAAPMMAAARLVGASEPPPPPFVQEPQAPAPKFDPLSEEGLEGLDESRLHEPSPATSPGAARVDAKAQASPRSGASPLRFLPHAVGVGGLALFAGAVATILKGQPNLVMEGAGLAGAVLMAGALYKLLGAPKP